MYVIPFTILFLTADDDALLHVLKQKFAISLCHYFVRTFERLSINFWAAGSTVKWLTNFSTVILTMGIYCSPVFFPASVLFHFDSFSPRSHDFCWPSSSRFNFHVHFIKPSNFITTAVSWHSPPLSKWFLRKRYALLLCIQKNLCNLVHLLILWTTFFIATCNAPASFSRATKRTLEIFGKYTAISGFSATAV